MGGRIIIADDLVTDRIALKARMAAARHSVVHARSPEELAARARADRPDVILIDVDFPGGGIEACRAMKAAPTTSDVPVIIYGAGTDRAIRMDALRAGADECLARLPGEALLLALLRNLTRKRAERAELMRRQSLHGVGELAEAPAEFAPLARITVVPPHMSEGPIWRHEIAAHCAARLTLASAASALEPAALADVYVVALPPAGPGSAFGLIAELRARPATRHALILLHSAHADDETAGMALDFGADAVMRGAFSGEELAARLAALVPRKREADRLRDRLDSQLDEALRDPLTGLFNRRYTDAYLARMMRDRAAGDRPCALLLLDLDHFKRVNDRFGHLTGDAVLAETARRLCATLRDIDLVARIGGEEFLVVLRDMDADQAARTAERLRAAVGDMPVEARAGGPVVPVTVSIGVALCSGLSPDPRDLFDRADRALYAAKAGGRNRVTFAPERSVA